MPQSLLPLSDSFRVSRLGLHRTAAYVVSPARRRSMGRIGLRATPGGFGTPPFKGPDGMTQIGVEGVSLMIHSDSGRRLEPITTLNSLAAFVGIEPDIEWAAEFDIPTAGDPTADLSVDSADAAALAAYFAFGWGILEKLSMDPNSEHASEPQLWPEHFDAAIEIGDPSGTGRASFGFSPGDVARDAGDGPESEPYVYVAPWYPDAKPESEYWAGGPLAILRYADLVGESDPEATVRSFLVEGRDVLNG